MSAINHKLVEIALDHVSGDDFERFVGVFYPAISGVDLVPTGGMHDGGADAYQDTEVWEGRRPNTFYQASVQEDHRHKIRRTITRLRQVGRAPTSLVYVTSRVIEMPDLDEESLAAELNIHIKIRSRNWIAANVNQSPRTMGAFNTYLRPHLDFMRGAGGATFITSSKHIQSRAVCVFLGQEVERRRSKSPILESVADSLILWALDKTDPDTGIFMTRSEIIGQIEATFPASKQFLRGIIDHRISVLSAKGNPTGREIRWYRKEGKGCLPYETRLIIEQENVEDEYLKTRVVEGFDLGAQALLRAEGLEEPTSAAIANLVLDAIERTFENSGLELAAFLQDGGTGDQCPPISDNVDAALQNSTLKGVVALNAKSIAMQLIRRAFYESTPEQREYFAKLSRTYALLFSIQADPRVVEYFQSMSAKFVLVVGTDMLIRALSERYLRPEDQMTCNMLKVLADAGSTLILTEPVVEEVHRHLETTDWEFTNHFSYQEPYVDLNVARHASKILIRAYFYAKLRPIDGVGAPKGWKSFIGQFCDYAALHRQGEGRQQITQYLTAKFGMEFWSKADLSALTSEKDVEELAKLLKPFKKEDGQDVLATNDALLILAVYGKRRALKEDHQPNPYGYSTWWLTQESQIQKATVELVQRKGAKYVIRPDFILNFISLSPSTEAVRKTYGAVMPTLLGIRLSNRMREDVFHDVMAKAREAFGIDDARATVVMGALSNKLKGDSFKQYQVQWAQGDRKIWT